MPIYSRLRHLLADGGMSQTQLQLKTGLAYSTISDLYHNKTGRIDLATLDVICTALSCGVGDILWQTSDARETGVEDVKRPKKGVRDEWH
jgi:putative transcriptional regulator